jgi:GAF domain-containing protein
MVASFLDEELQWIKAQQGFSIQETHRNVSVCAFSIKEDHALVVPDTHTDPRFSANPLVLGELHVRAYVGVPLRTPTLAQYVSRTSSRAT